MDPIFFTPVKQFDFCRSETSDTLYFVSEIVTNKVTLCEIGKFSKTYNVCDLRKLYREYKKINLPYDLDALTSQVLAIMHDIVNVDEIMHILSSMGAKNLNALTVLRQPFESIKVDSIYVKDRDGAKEIFVSVGSYCAYVFGGSMLGSISLQRSSDSIELNDICAVASVRDVIGPANFYNYARNFLVSFICEFCFWLAINEDVHDYLSDLLWALEDVVMPDIEYDAKWEDFIGAVHSSDFGGFAVTGSGTKALSAFDSIISDEEQ